MMKNSVALINGEVQLTLGRNPLSLPVQEITRITACFLKTRHETLTLLALLHESGHELEIRNDINGWETLLEDLALALSASSQTWRSQIQSLNEQNDFIILFTR